MNNKDIDTILKLLEREGLDKTKEILKNMKDENISFELANYINNYIAFSNNDSGKKCACYISENGQLIVTNGISIYYINKNFSKLAKKYIFKLIKFEKSLKKITSIYQILDYKNLKSIEDNIEKPRSCFVIVDTKENNNDKILFENQTYKASNKKEKYICHEFSNGEIELANKILNNPNFYVDINEPIATAENEIGKVFIKGKKKY